MESKAHIKWEPGLGERRNAQHLASPPPPANTGATRAPATKLEAIHKSTNLQRHAGPRRPAPDPDADIEVLIATYDNPDKYADPKAPPTIDPKTGKPKRLPWPHGLKARVVPNIRTRPLGVRENRELPVARYPTQKRRAYPYAPVPPLTADTETPKQESTVETTQNQQPYHPSTTTSPPTPVAASTIAVEPSVARPCTPVQQLPTPPNSSPPALEQEQAAPPAPAPLRVAESEISVTVSDSLFTSITSDGTMSNMDNNNTPAVLMVGGFAPPPPPDEYLALVGGLLDPKYPPDLPHEPVLERRREELKRCPAGAPIPWEDIEQLLETSESTTKEFRDWVPGHRQQANAITRNYRWRADQMKSAMRRLRIIDNLIGDVFGEVEKRWDKMQKGQMKPNTMVRAVMIKNVRSGVDFDEPVVHLPPLKDMPLEPKERKQLEMLYRKDKETRERLIPVEKEFLALRDKLLEKQAELEARIIDVPKYHLGERIFPEANNATGDDLAVDAGEAIPVIPMSEKARGKQPVRPVPNLNGNEPNSTRQRQNNSPEPTQSDQSGSEFNSRGHPVPQTGPPIEDLEPSIQLHVPDWFRHLDDEDIVPLTAETSEGRYEELLNMVHYLKEEKAFGPAKRFNKIWHPRGPWRLQQRRNGWWGRCRRGSDVLDPLENQCKLCHSPLEEVEIEPPQRVKITSKVAEFLNWTEPEPLDRGPVRELLPKGVDRSVPAAEQYDHLMAVIADAQAHVGQEDKKIAIAMLRADQREAQEVAQRGWRKVQGGFMPEPYSKFDTIGLSPREASEPLPRPPRRGPARVTELLGSIAIFEEQEQEKRDTAWAGNLGRNRLVYGGQEGQVWDATAHDRRERAKAIGKATAYERSLSPKTTSTRAVYDMPRYS